MRRRGDDDWTEDCLDSTGSRGTPGGNGNRKDGKREEGRTTGMRMGVDCGEEETHMAQKWYAENLDHCQLWVPSWTR